MACSCVAPRGIEPPKTRTCAAPILCATSTHFLALGQPVDAPAPFRGDLDLDHGANRRVGLPGQVKDRAPTEEHPVLPQLLKVLADLGFGDAGGLRHLRRREMNAFGEELEDRVHNFTGLS